MLAARHRGDAGAHHFGHEGGGVEHRPSSTARNSGVSAPPPSTCDSLSSGRFHSMGAPPASQPISAKPTTSSQRHPEHRPAAAGQRSKCRAPSGVPTAATTPTQNAGDRQPWPGPQCGEGKDRPFLLRKNPCRCAPSVHGGQVFGERQVPHQQLQQHRDVAEGLHVAVAQAAHQGVAREAAHAQQGAEEGAARCRPPPRAAC
jgi:hypothetical protein